MQAFIIKRNQMAKIYNQENIDISLLKEDGNNPNKMSQKSFEALKKTIKKYGFLVPVITNNEYIIADGAHRVRAAKDLGMQQIPVIKVDVSEVDRRLLRQIMNKLKGEHDYDLDLEEFKYLLENNYEENLLDLLPDSSREIKNMLREIETADIKEDDDFVDVEAYERAKNKTKIQKGDIFKLGDHRLMCGDSINRNEVYELMHPYIADMCFTDPPYNINYGNIKHLKSKQRNIKNDNMNHSDFKEFCSLFIKNIKNNVSGCVYICGPPGIDGRIMFTEADNLLYCSTTIIWNKDQFTLGRGKYQNKYEPIWFGWVDNGNKFSEERTLVNVWDIKRPKSSDLHPTMKPIELCTRAILDASSKGHMVLDLFGGSGSTLIACEQLGRKCFMMELDPVYVEVICQRWEKFTGKQREQIK